MSHQHAQPNSGQPHIIHIHNKLTMSFLRGMHDTELWASHIPRVPLGLYLLALVGIILFISAFTWSSVSSLFTKIALIIVGIIAILPAVFAWRFAQRKWNYASHIREHIFDAVELKGNEKVLDVGCGGGLLLNGAAKRLTTGQAIGIDIWAPHTGGGNYDLLMKNAKAEGVADKIQFKQADVRDLPFEDESFDVILSSGALHHISHEMPDHEKAIKEMLRVLKPGGRIAVFDTSHMVKGYGSRMRSMGITNEVQEAVNSPFGFEMSVMIGKKDVK